MSADLDPRVEDVVRLWQRGATPMVHRSRARLERILDGFELVEPGMVPVHAWTAPTGPSRPPGNAPHGVVARKP